MDMRGVKAALWRALAGRCEEAKTNMSAFLLLIQMQSSSWDQSETEGLGKGRVISFWSGKTRQKMIFDEANVLDKWIFFFIDTCSYVVVSTVFKEPSVLLRILTVQHVLHILVKMFFMHLNSLTHTHIFLPDCRTNYFFPGQAFCCSVSWKHACSACVCAALCASPARLPSSYRYVSSSYMPLHMNGLDIVICSNSLCLLWQEQRRATQPAGGRRGRSEAFRTGACGRQTFSGGWRSCEPGQLTTACRTWLAPSGLTFPLAASWATIVLTLSLTPNLRSEQSRDRVKMRESEKSPLTWLVF